MITFRSKAKTIRVLLTNSGEEALEILTEPWAEELKVQAQEQLELIIPIEELHDEHNPLNFELSSTNGFISIWCPPGAKLNVVPKTDL